MRTPNWRLHVLRTYTSSLACIQVCTHARTFSQWKWAISRERVRAYARACQVIDWWDWESRVRVCVRLSTHSIAHALSCSLGLGPWTTAVSTTSSTKAKKIAAATLPSISEHVWASFRAFEKIVPLDWRGTSEHMTKQLHNIVVLLRGLEAKRWVYRVLQFFTQN